MAPTATYTPREVILNNLVSRLKLILMSKLNLNFVQSRYFSVVIESLKQIALEVIVFCSTATKKLVIVLKARETDHLWSVTLVSATKKCNEFFFFLLKISSHDKFTVCNQKASEDKEIQKRHLLPQWRNNTKS